MSKYLTRKELYYLVWSEVTMHLSDQLNISTYRLQKICKENRIPVASLDYWTMEMLEKTEKPTLPTGEDLPAEMMIEIVSDQAMNMRKLNERRQVIERDCQDYLIVPKRPFDPDSLITAAKYTLENEKKYEYGRKDGFRTTKEGQIHISVTKKHIGRALRILDTFIKLVRYRGYEIKLNYSSLMIFTGEYGYDFGVREKQKRIPIRDGFSDYEPTGELVLFVGPSYHRKEFADGPNIPVEQHLSKALAYIEKDSDECKESRIRNEIQEKKLKEKALLLQQIKEKEEKEKRMADELISVANKWHQAMIIRDFIVAFEESIQRKEKQSEKALEWLNWAKRRVDYLDPVLQENEDDNEGEFLDSLINEKGDFS